MNESFRKKTTLERKNFEGNVLAPQTGAGIVIQSIKHIFDSENPQQEIAKLVKLISIDEDLLRRTEKANAQHAHFGIGKQLTPEEIQTLQSRGNVAVLSYLARILNVPYPISDLSGSNYAHDEGSKEDQAPTVVTYIQEKLTPETISIIREIFIVLSDSLKETDFRELLEERKTAYREWSTKDESEKKKSHKEVGDLDSQLETELKSKVGEFLGRKDLTIEQKQIVKNILSNWLFYPRNSISF